MRVIMDKGSWKDRQLVKKPAQDNVIFVSDDFSVIMAGLRPLFPMCILDIPLQYLSGISFTE